MTLDEYIQQLGLTLDPLNSSGVYGPDTLRYFAPTGQTYWRNTNYAPTPDNARIDEQGNWFLLSEDGLTPYQRQVLNYTVQPAGDSMADGTAIPQFDASGQMIGANPYDSGRGGGVLSDILSGASDLIQEGGFMFAPVLAGLAGAGLGAVDAGLGAAEAGLGTATGADLATFYGGMDGAASLGGGLGAASEGLLALQAPSDVLAGIGSTEPLLSSPLTAISESGGLLAPATEALAVQSALPEVGGLLSAIPSEALPIAAVLGAASSNEATNNAINTDAGTSNQGSDMTLNEYIQQLGLTADPMNAMGVYGDARWFTDPSGQRWTQAPQYSSSPQVDENGTYTPGVVSGYVMQRPGESMADGTGVYQFDAQGNPVGQMAYESGRSPWYSPITDSLTDPAFLMLGGGLAAGMGGLGLGATEAGLGAAPESGMFFLGPEAAALPWESGALANGVTVGGPMSVGLPTATQIAPLAAAGGAAGAAAGGSGVTDLGGGLSIGADGAITGATPGAASGLSNAQIMSAIGAGSSLAAPDATSGLSGLLSSIPGGAGTVAAGLGALAGSQGVQTTTTANQAIDPRLDPAVYGSGGLVNQAQGLLSQQMPSAASGASALTSRGQGLLGGTGGYQQAYQGMADDIQRRSLMATQDALRGIKSGFVPGGGVGNTRQALAEGTAIGRGIDSLQGNLANLNASMWNSDQSRNLQSIGLGADLLNAGQSMAWNPLQQASSLYQPWRGANSTTTNSQGGGMMGALGGGLGAAQMWQNLMK